MQLLHHRALHVERLTFKTQPDRGRHSAMVVHSKYGGGGLANVKRHARKYLDLLYHGIIATFGPSSQDGLENW